MTLSGPDSTKLAEQFEERWAGDDIPDVAAFLEECLPVTINERVQVLIVDQRHRWQRGVGRFVEDYVRICSDLDDDCYLKLQFISEEFNALEELGQQPQISEFLSRFPDIEASLIREVLGCDDQNERRARLLSTIGGDFSDIDSFAPVDATLAEPLDPQPTVAIEIGQQIGRYSITSLLGAGAYGRVYAALDTELHRTIAIKVPNPRRFRKKQDADQYLSEARVVARLDHPNIVPVYDVGQTPAGLCFTVSKLINGKVLSDVIENSLPTFEKSVELVAQMAMALDYAHNEGIIHRDIKPGNVLIDQAGKPNLVDFGLALEQDSVASGPGFAGTPAYMSPEQARGEGNLADGRSDLFSLGVVFYELLTQKRPFHGDTAKETFESVKSQVPQPPHEFNESVPVELSMACLKAISKSAEERFQTGRELADDLRRLMATGLSKTPGKLTIDRLSAHPRMDRSCLLVLDVTNFGGTTVEIDTIMLHADNTQMMLGEPALMSTVYPDFESAPANQCVQIFDAEISGLVRPGDMEMCPMSVSVEPGVCKRLGIRVSADDLAGNVGELDVIRRWKLSATCMTSNHEELSTDPVSVCLPYEVPENAAGKIDGVSIAVYSGEKLGYCRHLNQPLVLGRQRNNEPGPFSVAKTEEGRRVVICSNKPRWISRNHIGITFDELTERATIQMLSTANRIVVWHNAELVDIEPGDETSVDLPVVVILDDKLELNDRLPYRHIIIE